MANIIRRASLSKQVSDELEQMIENGEYAIGEKIPTEPELMEMFQVSRNTIREAIQGLTNAGLLEIKQGNGTFVCSSSRFQASMNRKYDNVSLDDIKEVRSCIEVTLAHLAATRCTDADFDQITNSFHHRQNLNTNTKENTLADMEFHMNIAYASHNAILIDLYKSIAVYLEEHISKRSQLFSKSNEEIDRLHLELYQAIQERNPQKAAQAAHNIVNI